MMRTGRTRWARGTASCLPSHRTHRPGQPKNEHMQTVHRLSAESSRHPVHSQSSVGLSEQWRLNYRHSWGEVGERFLAGLRNGEVLARKCPVTGQTVLPPWEGLQPSDHEPAELVPVGPNGTLQTWMTSREDGHAITLVCALPDGASWNLVAPLAHRGLSESELRSVLRPGVRVHLRIDRRSAGLRGLRFELIKDSER